MEYNFFGDTLERKSFIDVNLTVPLAVTTVSKAEVENKIQFMFGIKNVCVCVYLALGAKT